MIEDVTLITGIEPQAIVGNHGMPFLCARSEGYELFVVQNG
jgi:hypothetical protein